MLIDDQSSFFNDPRFVQSLERAQLDLNSLRHHHMHFLSFKANGMKNPNFDIQDSCRTDNGRILPYARLEEFPRTVKNLASFIPAAGSSTRYLEPLYKQKLNSTESLLRDSEWLLPKDPHSKELLPLETMLKLPKALYPCVEEGRSFLELKFMEQDAIEGLEKTICIVPLQNTDLFLSAMQTLEIPKEDLLFLEQGPELSTLRLDKNGLAFEDELELSIAPAGHGSLLKLFPQIKKHYPDIDSLFIRNIDNVIGCKKENVEITQSFLGAHYYTLTCIQEIRKFLLSNKQCEAAEEATKLLEKFPPRELSSKETKFLNEVQNIYEKALWTLQISVFQTPVDLARKVGLLSLFERPLNFLGQVPNLGQDRGGTPVLVRTEWGDAAVCVELPHFSEQDQIRLKDPQFASHFNPVFASVELQSTICHYEEKNPYWIFAEKQWYGKTVYYHESLLYELIGNSVFSNLVFVELPRSIFNPHKTLDNTKGQTLKRWI